MVRLQTIGIAVVAIILVAVVGWFLRRRYLQRQEEASDTGTERVADYEAQQQSGVPYRSRVSKMPTPAKVLLGSTVALLLLIIYNVYQYLKTGSPMQAAFSHEVQLLLVAVLAAIGGMWLKRRLELTYAWAYAVYEPAPDNDLDEPTVEAFPFDPDDTVSSKAGTLIPEYQCKTLFGLFRRPRLVGEDQRLVNDSELYRPPEDKIEHQVPTWATELPNGDLIWRTLDDTVNSSPEVPADYEYKTPFILDRDQYRRLRREKHEMLIELREKKNLVARLNETIENLEQENENKSAESIQEALDLIQRVQDLVGDTSPQYNYEQYSAPGHNGANGTVNKQNGQQPPSQQMEGAADS